MGLTAAKVTATMGFYVVENRRCPLEERIPHQNGCRGAAAALELAEGVHIEGDGCWVDQGRVTSVCFEQGQNGLITCNVFVSTGAVPGGYNEVCFGSPDATTTTTATTTTDTATTPTTTAATTTVAMAVNTTTTNVERGYFVAPMGKRECPPAHVTRFDDERQCYKAAMALDVGGGFYDPASGGCWSTPDPCTLGLCGNPLFDDLVHALYRPICLQDTGAEAEGGVER